MQHAQFLGRERPIEQRPGIWDPRTGPVWPLHNLRHNGGGLYCNALSPSDELDELVEI